MASWLSTSSSLVADYYLVAESIIVQTIERVRSASKYQESQRITAYQDSLNQIH